MDLHYNKHHQTYITNLNNALTAQGEAFSGSNLLKQLELQAIIRFNAGGHVNHTLFWENLSPHSSGNSDITKAAPQLYQAITQRWKTLDQFKTAFESAALAIQGSGWVWLVKDKDSNAIDITTSKDQELPPPPGKLVLIGVDMWEHAYYLQYFNNKKQYISNIWDIINWKTAEKRFLGDVQAIYGELTGLSSHL
ncbi:hypothetical protein B0A52_05546 [Exophiala mesophila]|uniref:Superoxide dismutase n=1 Tax=Exophiala mesophila TaxID=212818 RepID=A0A438N379_EXOME|nr:hypothetical protein B0A52_05546 [Exophiala mesophila]